MRRLHRTAAVKSSVEGRYISAGGIDIKTLIKFHRFLVFHISILWELVLCCVWATPTKAPVATGLRLHVSLTTRLSIKCRTEKNISKWGCRTKSL